MKRTTSTRSSLTFLCSATLHSLLNKSLNSAKIRVNDFSVWHLWSYQVDANVQNKKEYTCSVVLWYRKRWPGWQVLDPFLVFLREIIIIIKIHEWKVKLQYITLDVWYIVVEGDKAWDSWSYLTGLSCSRISSFSRRKRHFLMVINVMECFKPGEQMRMIYFFQQWPLRICHTLTFQS